ncbi:hypothetical protein M405DRAFT_863079 [Rhizopogon salebrosus TDB-379]|nr:hypothetical protein M405DRAFT_863079 [Rhizopogon salebrosus TDB-379]
MTSPTLTRTPRTVPAKIRLPTVLISTDCFAFHIARLVLIGAGINNSITAGHSTCFPVYYFFAHHHLFSWSGAVHHAAAAGGLCFRDRDLQSEGLVDEKLKDAGTFLCPVDPAVDLGTIERKLMPPNPSKPDPNPNNPRYYSAEEFVSDGNMEPIGSDDEARPPPVFLASGLPHPASGSLRPPSLIT